MQMAINNRKIKPEMCEKLSYEKPALSIIIVTICGSTYLARCLNALRQQVDAPKLEIIVVYDERLGDVLSLTNKFPDVQMYTKYGIKTPEELASVGITKARADVVALTEDHCIPDQRWCRCILYSHAESYAAVGGIVECASQSILGWAFAFTDYYRYLSPVPEGETSYLTVCNVSYKRQALDKIAHVWKSYFHETHVHEALQRNHETLWLAPSLVVSQERNVQFFPAVRERFSFGRLFGSRRVAAISPALRVFYSFASPLIPLLLLSRMLRNILLRKGNLYVFVRAIPFLLLFTMAWSLGELFGYLLGRPPRDIYIART